MKNIFRWISLTVLIAVMLTGCSQAATPAAPVEADETPTSVAEGAEEAQAADNDETQSEETQAEEETQAGEEKITPEAEATQDEGQAGNVEEPETVSMLAASGEDCMVSQFEDLLPIPPVSEEDWVEGSLEAPTTILVYSDLQCPYCSIMDPLLEELQQKYPDDIRLIWRHFPLSYHGNSMAASQAVEAAGKQNRDAFFELKTRIFAAQSEWSEMTPEEFSPWLEEQAADMDLDMDQFKADMTDEALTEKIQKSFIGGQTIVSGTPFVLINGIPAAAYGPDLEGAYLNAKALRERQFDACPTMALSEGVDYKALLKTDKGDVTIDLLEDEAPITVNNFIFLAQNGWFDNVPFHRVIPDFVAQAGDPLGLGFGGPGYIFVNEINDDLKYDKEGVVGMANSGEDTNGSQFFITYEPLEQLNGNYTIFGQVVDGMDVAKSLTSRDPASQEELPEPSIIQSVEIIEE